MKRNEKRKETRGVREMEGCFYLLLFGGALRDLLLTPFLPLRSCLYCSFSRVIRPWSTSHASPGLCSSFSIRDTHTNTRVNQGVRKCLRVRNGEALFCDETIIPVQHQSACLLPPSAFEHSSKVLNVFILQSKSSHQFTHILVCCIFF